MIGSHGDCFDHAYQDKRYGKGNRVLNPVTVNGKLEGVRCTVCAPPKEKGKKRGYIPLSQVKFKT